MGVAPDAFKGSPLRGYLGIYALLDLAGEGGARRWAEQQEAKPPPGWDRQCEHTGSFSYRVFRRSEC